MEKTIEKPNRGKDGGRLGSFRSCKNETAIFMSNEPALNDAIESGCTPMLSCLSSRMIQK